MSALRRSYSQHDLRLYVSRKKLQEIARILQEAVRIGKMHVQVPSETVAVGEPRSKRTAKRK